MDFRFEILFVLVILLLSVMLVLSENRTGGETLEVGSVFVGVNTTTSINTTAVYYTATVMPYPGCSDGILNQGEEIDCGGPCSPCTVKQPGISGQVIRYNRGENLLLFNLILLLAVGFYHVRRKRSRELDRRYEGIIDSILSDRI